MNEAEIMQEEENILQQAAQHQDRLEQEERLREILRRMLLVCFEQDVDFLAGQLGLSDYRK